MAALEKGALWQGLKFELGRGKRHGRGGTGMGNYLNIGNGGFRSSRKGLYVDKTGSISHINETLGTMKKLSCVSRPDALCLL